MVNSRFAPITVCIFTLESVGQRLVLSFSSVISPLLPHVAFFSFLVCFWSQWLSLFLSPSPFPGAGSHTWPWPLAQFVILTKNFLHPMLLVSLLCNCLTNRWVLFCLSLATQPVKSLCVLQGRHDLCLFLAGYNFCLFCHICVKSLFFSPLIVFSSSLTYIELHWGFRKQHLLPRAC